MSKLCFGLDVGTHGPCVRLIVRSYLVDARPVRPYIVIYNVYLDTLS